MRFFKNHIYKITCLILLACLFSSAFVANAISFKNKPSNDTIFVTAFGAKPDSRIDAVPAVRAALKACEGKRNAVLVFPKGRYDFWPKNAPRKMYYESNTTNNAPKTTGILLEKLNNIVIDGKGSSFIYHGTMQPFTIDSCNGVSLKNISIDWDYPLTGQGEVIDTASDHIDVRIDEKQYPFEIARGKIIFMAEGWKSGITGVMEFESGKHIIAPQTGDSQALGKGWQKYVAQSMPGGIVRFIYPFERRPAPGNILVFRHSPRDHAAMFILNCKNVTLRHLDIHHSAGLGILCQYTDHLDFRNINVVPETSKDRYFSGHDDGMHFSNCMGQIVVDSCRFAGLMDDPINIHGTYVKVIQKIGGRKLRCRFMEPMSTGMVWARTGEYVGFINHESLQTIGRSTVTSFRALSVTDFEIALADDVPSYLRIGDGLENLTWTPAATISNSSFESCRARGILVTTPQKVVIENNTFSSSGSAILVAGDVNSWYESGNVNDLLIKDNKFLSATMTSLYQFCEAIISLYPEIPVMNAQTPAYHHNIRIIGNEFHVYDYPVLFAQSVDGLAFEDNQLIRSYDYTPFHQRKATFSFIGCKNVIVKNNQVDQALLGKNVSLKLMPGNELRLIQPEIHVDQ